MILFTDPCNLVSVPVPLVLTREAVPVVTRVVRILVVPWVLLTILVCLVLARVWTLVILVWVVVTRLRHLLRACRVLVRVLLVCPTLFLTVLVWLLSAPPTIGSVNPVRILNMTKNVVRLTKNLNSGTCRMPSLFLLVVSS